MERYMDYMNRKLKEVEDTKQDMVNSPIHYNKAGIETIDSSDIEPNWFRSLVLIGSPLSTKFVSTNLVYFMLF